VRWGLVQQLFFTVLLAALATGGMLLLGGGLFLLAEGERALWQEARGLARDLSFLVLDDLLLSDRLAVEEKLRHLKDRYPHLAYVYILNPRGEVVAHTLSGGVPEALARLGGEKVLQVGGKTVYQVEAGIMGGEAGVVRLGLERTPLVASLFRVVRAGLFGLLWAVGLGGALGYLFLARLLEPLSLMVQEASRLKEGQPARFPEPPHELGALGRALNAMGAEVRRRERDLRLLNRLLSEMHALDLATLSERVLGLLVRELGFTCGDLWLSGRVVHCEACRDCCPLGGVASLAQEALASRQVVVRPQGVAVPVPPHGALVLHGRPEVEEAWLRAFLEALAGPLATALENARLYEALAEKEAQRARLLKAWLKAQEEERARIARELHDEVGQALTGLILGLEGLPGDRVEALKELARHTLTEVRRLALDLRPSVLDHLGLEAALRRYVREYAERTGVEVDLSFHLTRPLPQELETVVYRVVQEALTNVARHSGSPRASVGVVEVLGEVRVFVEDEGRGFDPEAVDPGRQGLLGMRERVELLGGRLSVESAPGQGTRVQVRLPIGVAA
jgi:signal transduction histidine kinase